MSIFRNIMTAIRGGVREVGESIVDANGVRILDQQIKDAEEHLRKAKHDLTDVMAKHMQSNRKLEALKADVTEHENYAAQALDKGNESLALEIADKIANLDMELQDQQGVCDNLKQHVIRLKDLVRKSERQIADYQRQLSMVRTTESVQKATAAITDNFSSSRSKVLSAKESLDRIKKKQQNFDDRLKAAEELQNDEMDTDLKVKMKSAGIGEQSSNANSVLERIKSRRG